MTYKTCVLDGLLEKEVDVPCAVGHISFQQIRHSDEASIDARGKGTFQREMPHRFLEYERREARAEWEGMPPVAADETDPKQVPVELAIRVAEMGEVVTQAMIDEAKIGLQELGRVDFLLVCGYQIDEDVIRRAPELNGAGVIIVRTSWSFEAC